jgi:hypothetical protein
VTSLNEDNFATSDSYSCVFLCAANHRAHAVLFINTETLVKHVTLYSSIDTTKFMLIVCTNKFNRVIFVFKGNCEGISLVAVFYYINLHLKLNEVIFFFPPGRTKMKLIFITISRKCLKIKPLNHKKSPIRSSQHHLWPHCK